MTGGGGPTGGTGRPAVDSRGGIRIFCVVCWVGGCGCGGGPGGGPGRIGGGGPGAGCGCGARCGAAGGPAGEPSRKTSRGPRCGSPSAIVWPSRMSTVGTRAPSTKMPARLRSIATQCVPTWRSSRSGCGFGGGGAAKPKRSSAMSHQSP
ncbi:hypothetical protein A5647_15945 [Mycobacterium sp. 1100029.7]|nr:hypothetical protein A5647_15945 [Mycobacterium sp. 1100029.7]